MILKYKDANCIHLQLCYYSTIGFVPVLAKLLIIFNNISL